jgi:uncharacterized protein DUF4232
MKHLSTTAARRVTAVAAAVAAAGLATTSAAFAATSAPSAATPKCAANAGGPGLAVWVAVDQGNGAAGTIYYPLEFTNLSAHSCSLHGFPGVSAIDRAGRQLGSPAGWGSGTSNTVILAPGATAHAVLEYHDVVIGQSPGCHSVSTASELRVYPPDQRTAAHAFFDLQACSHAGPIYMDVGPIQPGAGTING